MRVKQVLSMLFLIGVVLGFHTVYAADILTQEQQAILDTAKAFLYRGKYIDYDSIGMNYYGDFWYGQAKKYMQRNYLVSEMTNTIPKDLDWMYIPEMATRQNQRYFVCSHFVHSVFYQAFEDSNGNRYILKDGKGNIPNITKYMCCLADENDAMYNPNVAVDFIVKDNSKIEEDKKRVLNKIQPGDVIVYGTGGGGHTGIYVGNGMVYESGGEKYNIKEKKDKIGATVVETSIEKFMDVAWTDESVKYVTILRPLNEIKSGDYHITSDTQKRMQYPDLVVEKIASTGRYESVNPGEQIIYSIILTNKSETNDYSNIKVTDKIPTNTEFVSMDSLGSNSSGTLSWNVNVEKGRSITLRYTVKVKGIHSIIGEAISNDSTIVNGIKINSIQTKIKRTLTKEEQTQVSNFVSSNVKEYSSTATFLNEVYPNVNFEEADHVLEEFFYSEKIDIKQAVYATVREDKTVYQLKPISSGDSYFTNMFIEGLWGGFYTLGLEKETYDDGRAVYVSSNSFTIGDVLVLADEDYKKDSYVAGEKNMYLYIAENKFATVDNGKLRIIENDEAKRLIESLIAQDCFVVLRPSYVMPEIVVQDPRNYQVGNEYFSTFEEAIKTISGKGTIKVLNTVEDYSVFNIDATQSIVLDTNGQKIYLKESRIINMGNLEIKGSGRLETDLDYLIINSGNIIVDGPVLVTNGMNSLNWYTIFSDGGTVTILNGNVGAKGVESENISNGRGIGLKNGAVLTIKGGQVKSYIGYAICSISSKTGSAGSEIIIEDGAISGAYGVHLSADGDYEVKTNVKMTGGSIETTNQAIDIQKNTDCTVVIEGGTLISKNGVGINHQGNGKLVIGKDDETISMDKLEIKGKLAAIQSENGFEFYDGILKGTDKTYDGEINKKPSNYYVYENVENSEKISYLKEIPNYLIGDINMDGIVNSTDLQRLYTHLNGTNLIMDIDNLFIVDVNSDRSVNSTDLQRLYTHLNGSNPLK